MQQPGSALYSALKSGSMLCLVMCSLCAAGDRGPAADAVTTYVTRSGTELLPLTVLQDPPLVSDTNKRTPLLMCHGDMDQVVRPDITLTASATDVFQNELQGSWPALGQGLNSQAAKLGAP